MAVTLDLGCNDTLSVLPACTPSEAITYRGMSPPGYMPQCIPPPPLPPAPLPPSPPPICSISVSGQNQHSSFQRVALH